MSQIRRYLIIVLLFSNILSQGQTRKVLFIGNSYTILNNLPQIAANIAISTGDQLIFSSSAIPNYSLQQHSVDANTLNLIRQGGWDYVVLQEYSQYPSEPQSWVESNVYPYARYLDQEINKYNSSAETMFYMTWGRKDGDASRCSRLPQVCTYIGMDDLTRQRYMYMAQSNNAVVSPVGAVWRYIRENYPTIELYDTDGSHPSAAGSYAAACCFYAAIFKKDPSLSTYNYVIDPIVASQIRNAARQVVYYNLSTWYIGNYYQFSVDVSFGNGGTINPSGTQKVSSGTTMKFNIVPASGYRISEVKVDNTSLGAVSSYTFRNITSDHSISATFVQLTNVITAGAGTGGEINPKGSITVNYGSSRVFSVTPAKGYKIADLMVDNSSVGAVDSYTFYNVTANHTISSFFTPLTYRLNCSAGPNGRINPEGTINVNYGSGQTFTIMPDMGYQISDVKVDGTSMGRISEYTFSNLTADHVISAEFSIKTYTVSENSTTGGSIIPKGTTTTNYGSNLTFTIIPDNGYHTSDVKVDGTSIGRISEFTFSNIIADHTISAEFSINTYTVTGNSTTGGSIIPEGTSTSNYGSSLVFTLVPDIGYHISDVKVDGISMGSISEFTLNNLTANHTITAEFSINIYHVKANCSSGGSITPSGEVILTHGMDQVFLISPENGYQIDDVLVDDISVGKVSEYIFKNITGDHSISALFIKIFTISAAAGIGGSITPSGIIILPEGTSIKFSITPDRDYRIKDVIVDKYSMGDVTEYIFTGIAADHNISASFTNSIDIVVFPNPFNEQLSLKIKSPAEYKFEMYIMTLTNMIVFRQDYIPGNGLTQINLDLAPGSYILKLYLKGNSISTTKIIRY